MHTGNTDVNWFAKALKPVYPRAYGEHIIMNSACHFFNGLSPCIRGTPLPRPSKLIFLRFIPVHTGNTRRYLFSYCLRSVYPRAYGEHVNHALLFAKLRGLSPCIRGTLPRSVVRLFSLRFIPVHTGNTDGKLKSVN